MLLYFQNFVTGVTIQRQVDPKTSIQQLFDTIGMEFGIHNSVLIVAGDVYMYRRQKDSRVIFPNGQNVKTVSELPEIELIQFMEACDDNMLNHNDDDSYDEQDLEEFTEDSTTALS